MSPVKTDRAARRLMNFAFGWSCRNIWSLLFRSFWVVLLELNIMSDLMTRNSLAINIQIFLPCFFSFIFRLMSQKSKLLSVGQHACQIFGTIWICSRSSCSQSVLPKLEYEQGWQTAVPNSTKIHYDWIRYHNRNGPSRLEKFDLAIYTHGSFACWSDASVCSEHRTLDLCSVKVRNPAPRSRSGRILAVELRYLIVWMKQFQYKGIKLS